MYQPKKWREYLIKNFDIIQCTMFEISVIMSMIIISVLMTLSPIEKSLIFKTSTIILIFIMIIGILPLGFDICYYEDSKKKWPEYWIHEAKRWRNSEAFNHENYQRFLDFIDEQISITLKSGDFDILRGIVERLESEKYHYVMEICGTPLLPSLEIEFQ